MMCCVCSTHRCENSEETPSARPSAHRAVESQSLRDLVALERFSAFEFREHMPPQTPWSAAATIATEVERAKGPGLVFGAQAVVVALGACAV